MIDYLHKEISAICPIHGLNSNGHIDFRDSATAEQRQAALDKYAELTSTDGIEAYQRTQMLLDYDIAIERELDRQSLEAGYYDPLNRIPNIDRACSYAGHDNPYQSEGQSFVAWRAAVWAYVYQVKADVESGLRAQPTITELIAELPARVTV